MVDKASSAGDRAEDAAPIEDLLSSPDMLLGFIIAITRVEQRPVQTALDLLDRLRQTSTTLKLVVAHCRRRKTSPNELPLQLLLRVDASGKRTNVA